MNQSSDVKRGIWTGISAAITFMVVIGIAWGGWQIYASVRSSINDQRVAAAAAALEAAESIVSPEFKTQAKVALEAMIDEHHAVARGAKSFALAEVKAKKEMQRLGELAHTPHEREIKSDLDMRMGPFANCVEDSHLSFMRESLSDCEKQFPETTLEQSSTTY